MFEVCTKCYSEPFWIKWLGAAALTTEAASFQSTLNFHKIPQGIRIYNERQLPIGNRLFDSSSVFLFFASRDSGCVYRGAISLRHSFHDREATVCAISRRYNRLTRRTH